MFAKPDLLLDVYRPLLRSAFAGAHVCRKISGERLFRLVRGAASRPPPRANARLPEGGSPVNVDSMLEAIVGSQGCPGMAALALRGDRIIAQGAAGFRK